MHTKIRPRQWGQLGLGILLLSSQAVYADISGKVFRDFNSNGALDASESGVGGVTVTATDSTGASATATTAADGTYSFPNSGVTADGNKVRLEFSNLPANANNGLASPGTGVQFVTAGSSSTNVNFAVAYAADYCEANPKMITPMYVASEQGGLNNLMMFSYLNEGTAAQDKTGLATSSQVGALWGVAYSRSEKKVYTSAVLKAHIPLGTEGLDAIYKVDPFAGTPNATPWLELTDDLGIAVSSVSANPQYADNTSRGLDSYPQNDASAFTDVMKVGIGDIELSADEKTLYVVNAYDKKLYAIDVASKAKAAEYAIPDPGCSNGQARPWALGERDGEIFVGVTCDGSSSGVPSNLADNSGVGNLKASVYRLDGSSFTQLLNFPLDYSREPSFRYASGGCENIDKWKPWLDVSPAFCGDGNVSYPTPMLTDIEFDDGGNMVLGFTDRTGFQFGNENYGPVGTDLHGMYAGGEILKACKTASGWGIEGSTAGCESAGGLAIGKDDADGYPMSWGVLAKPGEFYEGDFFHGDGNWDGTGLSYYPGHPENTIGGLAVVPGTGEVMSTAFDAVTGSAFYGRGGVMTLSNQTGKRTRNGYELFETTDTSKYLSGKGVGLGDLEMLCEDPPVEVGNRIWLDADEDGIQDADETGIDGVEVTLACGSNTATATTSNGGQYLFSSETNATFLQTGLDCTISVASGQTPLDGLSPTVQNAEGATDNDPVTDIRDSDASATGEVTFSTSGVGQNNHTLDVGYRTAPAVSVDVALTKTVQPTTANHGDTVTYTLTVTNTGPDAATGVVVTDKLPAGLTFVSHNGVSPGVYDAVTGEWNVGTVEVGEANAVTLQITATVN